jgi:hypothetical protein
MCRAAGATPTQTDAWASEMHRPVGDALTVENHLEAGARSSVQKQHATIYTLCLLDQGWLFAGVY